MNHRDICADISDYPIDPGKHDAYETGKLHGTVVEQIGAKAAQAVISALLRKGYAISRLDQCNTENSDDRSRKRKR